MLAPVGVNLSNKLLTQLVAGAFRPSHRIAALAWLPGCAQASVFIQGWWSSEEKKPRIVLPLARHDSDLEDRRGCRVALERLAGVEPDASSPQITALPGCDARDSIRAR